MILVAKKNDKVINEHLLNIRYCTGIKLYGRSGKETGVKGKRNDVQYWTTKKLMHFGTYQSTVIFRSEWII